MSMGQAMTSAAVQLYEDLYFAIQNADYARVQELLNDPKCPVNLRLIPSYGLAVETALSTANPRMIRLFINCPRIKWTASSRITAQELDAFGISYYEDCLDGLSSFDHYAVPAAPLVSSLACRQETETIQKLFFAEVAATFSHEELCLLPSKTLCNLSYFKEALSLCPDINFKDCHGRTLLHHICINEEALKLKLNFVLDAVLAHPGVDVNCVDEEDKTPLSYAQPGSLLAEKLMAKGATKPADSQNSPKQTPSEKGIIDPALQEAIRNDSLEAFKSLSPSCSPSTLLRAALLGRALKISAFLLEEMQLPVDLLLRFDEDFIGKDESIALLLLRHGSSPYNRILKTALLNNWTGVIRFLQQSRTDYARQYFHFTRFVTFLATNEAVWMFLQGEGIREQIRAKPEAMRMNFEQLCCNPEDYQFFAELGLNAEEDESEIEQEISEFDSEA